jgi:hypothetical protein
MTSDFVQLEHLANVIEDMSGSLLSGSVDPSLLAFENVDDGTVPCSSTGYQHV